MPVTIEIPTAFRRFTDGAQPIPRRRILLRQRRRPPPAGPIHRRRLCKIATATNVTRTANISTSV